MNTYSVTAIMRRLYKRFFTLEMIGINYVVALYDISYILANLLSLLWVSLILGNISLAIFWGEFTGHPNLEEHLILFYNPVYNIVCSS